MVNQQHTETNVENNEGQEELSEALEQLNLDVFAADIKKADGVDDALKKEEIAGDLDELRNETWLEQLYNEIDTIDQNQSVESIDQQKLAALDAVIWRWVIAEIMWDIIFKHKNPTTRWIDLAAVESEYSQLKIYDNTALKWYLASKQWWAQQKYVEMLLANTTFANSYIQAHVQQNVVSPLQDSVKLMVQEYNKFFDTSSPHALTPEQEEVVEKAAEEVKKKDRWQIDTEKQSNQSALKWAAILGTSAWILWFFKWLTEEKKENKDKKFWSRVKSWFLRAIKRWWIAWVWWGLWVKLWMSHKEKTQLTFEQSLDQAVADAKNIPEEHYNRVTNIKYEWWWITSYGYRSFRDKNWNKAQSSIKVNKWKRTIDALPWIVFPDHLQLIQASNFLNYLNCEYSWKWDNRMPFTFNPSNWDLEMLIWWENKEVFSWWFMSTLWSKIDELNSEKWKSLLLSYLNKQPHWYKKDRKESPRNPSTPEWIIANKIDEELKRINEELERDNDRNWILLNPIEGTKDYEVESRDQRSLKLKSHWDGKKYSIEWFDRTFDNFREWILVANLTNYFYYTFKWESRITNGKPFYYWKVLEWNPLVNRFYIWGISYLDVWNEALVKSVEVLDEKHYQKWGIYDFFKDDIQSGKYAEFLNNKEIPGKWWSWWKSTS